MSCTDTQAHASDTHTRVPDTCACATQAILSYDHYFFILIFFVVERGRTGAYAFLVGPYAVFPTLSLRRERPSHGTFFSFGNCWRGRTGHMISICMYSTLLVCSCMLRMLVCFWYAPVCTRMFLVCGFCHDQTNLLVS